MESSEASSTARLPIRWESSAPPVRCGYLPKHSRGSNGVVACDAQRLYGHPYLRAETTVQFICTFFLRRSDTEWQEGVILRC